MAKPSTSSTTATADRPARHRRTRPFVVGTLTAVTLAACGALAVRAATDNSPRPPAVSVAGAIGPAAGPDATATPANAGADVRALWRTLLELDPRQTAVIVPALAPEVRAALEAITNGVVDEGLVDGVADGNP
jgi:hypothetical protein